VRRAAAALPRRGDGNDTNCTIAANTARGVGWPAVSFGDRTPVTAVTNTIIASNSGGNCKFSPGSTYAGGHNIQFGDMTCSGNDRPPLILSSISRQQRPDDADERSVRRSPASTARRHQMLIDRRARSGEERWQRERNRRRRHRCVEAAALVEMERNGAKRHHAVKP